MSINLLLLAGLVTVSALRVLAVRAVNNEIDRQRASRPQLMMGQRRQATLRPSATPAASHPKSRQPLAHRHS